MSRQRVEREDVRLYLDELDEQDVSAGADGDDVAPPRRGRA